MRDNDYLGNNCSSNERAVATSGIHYKLEAVPVLLAEELNMELKKTFCSWFLA